MPCREWSDEQDAGDRDSVITSAIKARGSVEAAVPMGWREIVGGAGRVVSINHYGASASPGTLFSELGFSGQTVAAAAKESLTAVSATEPRRTPASAGRRRRPTRSPTAASRSAEPPGRTADQGRPALPSARTRFPHRGRRAWKGTEMSERLKALADAGVSIWLDDLSRERLNSNNLAELVAESSVVGVTTTRRSSPPP